MLNFIQKTYCRLEYGGILFVELPDCLLDSKSTITPESLECICKEFGYRDIRTYKTPLNKDGYFNYIVTAKKIHDK